MAADGGTSRKRRTACRFLSAQKDDVTLIRQRCDASHGAGGRGGAGWAEASSGQGGDKGVRCPSWDILLGWGKRTSQPDPLSALDRSEGSRDSGAGEADEGVHGDGGAGGDQMM